MLELFAVAAALAAHPGPAVVAAGPEGKEPPVVRIVARDFEFDAPDRLPAGPVKFELVNEGPEPHHAWIVRFEEGHDLAEFVEALHAGGMPAWAVDMGGPQVMMEPGAVSDAIIDMRPGRYALICHVPSPDGLPHLAKGMAKEFVVEPDPDNPPAPMPAAEFTIDLVDYAFVFEKPLRAGAQRVRFVNSSPQTHELVLWRLHEGKHVADAVAWVETMAGPPPGEVVGGVAGIAPGVENLVDLDLAPGLYAATCFVPDAGDGKLHTEHGMMVEFEVK